MVATTTATATSGATSSATAATAAMDTTGESHFWCHECACRVATREADDGEVCCATCDGNFVEEVEADDPPEQFLTAPADAASGENSSVDAPAARSHETMDAYIAQIHDGFDPRGSDETTRTTRTPQTPPSTATNENTTTAATPPRANGAAGGGDAPSPLTELLQQLMNGGGGAGAGGGGTRTARIIRSNGTPVEFYVTSTGDATAGELGGGGLFGLLAGAMNAPFGGGGGGAFVGNPGDYALGSNHLSQLINQLMQNDPNRHGAPPAAKEVVERLPSHKVEQREVDANAECAVCKDLFAVDDDAKDLPCTHSFHPDCITPWLKMHNSCPVCRFELPTDDQDYEERRRHHDHPADQASANARW